MSSNQIDSPLPANPAVQRTPALRAFAADFYVGALYPMRKLAPSLMSAAAVSHLRHFVVCVLLSCLLVGCAASPSSSASEGELSQALAPCAENGKVKGSMQRTVASDGTITYAFTPDCLANPKRPEQSRGAIPATEANGAH